MGKIDWSVNRSKVFAVPMINGLKREKSLAMRVGKNQIAAANAFAKSVGCGEPYCETGHPILTTPEKKKLMREINHRRVDQGEPRYVNLDGGFGDET